MVKREGTSAQAAASSGGAKPKRTKNKTKIATANVEQQSTKKWSELPACSICNAAIDESVNALECEMCDKTWTCTGCLNISDDLYEMLTGTPLRWFCSTCDVKVMHKGQNETETNLMKMMESLLDRVKNIEVKLCESGGTEIATVVKSSIEKIEGKIEEKLGGGLASYAAAAGAAQNAPKGEIAGQNKKAMKEIIKEALVQQAEDEKEVEKRSKNIIIYRVPEVDAGDRGGAELEDRAFLKSLMEGPLELSRDKDPVKQIIRLGKKTEAKERPMLVKMDTEENKSEFMASLRKLKTAEERFKRISVAHDLSARQREAVKGALEEARREQGAQSVAVGSQSGNWVLRVVDQLKIPRVVRIRVDGGEQGGRDGGN